MSRTEPRGAVNLSSSSISISSDSSAGEQEEDGSDVEIEKILSEVRGFAMLDVLPPTPQRPDSRSQSRCSVASAVSSVFSSSRQSELNSPSKLNASPSKLSTCGSSKSGYNVESKKDRKARRKRTEKEILKDLGIDLDEEELEQMKEEERFPVDNVIDDIIDLGLGKTRVNGAVKTVTIENEKLDRQFQKLRKRAPLEINGDGRCAALKEDVTTIRNTLEKVNALVFALEKARDKLVSIKQIEELYFLFSSLI